jgi:class 3 adenylate cyclase/putative methionine-R-sulfoxide reductase with GAF domain
MAGLNREYVKRRTIGRRRDDRLFRDRCERYTQLLRVGQIITSETSLDDLFGVIMDQTNQVMDSERSTVFLHDNKSNQLWCLVATGMHKNEICIPADSGVAGWVFQSKTPMIINAPYDDPRFYSEIDKKTGYRTRNIICVPVMNRKKECIGTLQAINKKTGDFTDEDKELIVSVSHYVAIALENSKLFGDVNRYLEKLKATLVHIETLEKIKCQLTKFVPSSVARVVEKDPDEVELDKTPMDISVLFIDIQNFSKIIQSSDQRLVNEMVESHFSEYLGCISGHAGEITETSGDGLMVIFKDGSLKDNATRAVQAALEIVAQNKRLNKEAVYPWGPTELHLGINSGAGWVGSTKMKCLSGERWTYTASGLVTLLAARIGKLSSHSRLYVGQETYRQLENVFNCEPLGPQELKNVEDPVPVYRVKNIRNQNDSEPDVRGSDTSSKK